MYHRANTVAVECRARISIVGLNLPFEEAFDGSFMGIRKIRDLGAGKIVPYRKIPAFDDESVDPNPQPASVSCTRLAASAGKKIQTLISERDGMGEEQKTATQGTFQNTLEEQIQAAIALERAQWEEGRKREKRSWEEEVRRKDAELALLRPAIGPSGLRRR